MFSLPSLFRDSVSAAVQAHTVNPSSTNSRIASNLDSKTEAIVTRIISPGRAGQIKFQGSWWTARCLQGITLIPGMFVHVIGRQTITLYVEPMFSKPVQGD